MKLRSVGGIALAAWVVLPTLATPAGAQEPAARWRSQVELGFNGSSGNSSFSILTLGGSVTHLEQERFELELAGQMRYGRSDGATVANDQRGSLKFDWVPDADWSPFVYTTAERNVVRNLDARLVGGGGAKWTFWRGTGSAKASFSLAASLDYENFRLSASDPGPETQSVGRWSARLKFDHDFGGSATVQHVTFWQPRMSGFSDYLVDMTNSLSTDLLSNLSLVVRHEYLHDSVPPPGALRDDQRLSVVLRVRL